MHAAPIEQVMEDFTRHLTRLETYVAAWNDDPEKLGASNSRERTGLCSCRLSQHMMTLNVTRLTTFQTLAMEYQNSVKMSAYLCKWITRFKVIELATPGTQSEHEDVTAILLNGAFALYLCRTLIGAELRTPFYFTDQYGDEFQYDLLYREIGEDGLLHIFQMIFTAVGIRRAGVLEFVDQEVAASVFDD